MPKRRSAKSDDGAQAGAGEEPGAGDRRSAWHAGHLPHMPRTASDDEPDFVTGWFHERLLDGMFEGRAEGDGEDDQDSEQAAKEQRSSPGRWASGSPRHRRSPGAEDDLPDYEAECDDPPDRERP